MRSPAPTVVALVVGLGGLPILVPSALAEPVLPTEQRSPPVPTATAPLKAVELKASQVASASASLKVHVTRGDPRTSTV